MITAPVGLGPTHAWIGLFAVALLCGCATAKARGPEPVTPLNASAAPGTRVLVFTRGAMTPLCVAGRARCIPPGPLTPTAAAAIGQLGERHGFTVEQTEDRSIFTDESLARFSAVVFLNTAGDVLTPEQEAAFQQYIRAGGGFVGVTALINTEPDWPWFHGLVGTSFRRVASVPAPIPIHRTDPSHLSTQGIPRVWMVQDAFTEYHPLAPGVTVLALHDERFRPKPSAWDDEEIPPPYPASWYYAFEGGRSWYTGLGQRIETYSDPAFLNHLAGGILWAAGY